jgi:hypothetical protein
LTIPFAIPPQVRAGDLFTKVKAKIHNHHGTPTPESLAVEIQSLEKHIDWYGTIVAKQPDVWGQARLMKHRSEFERIMALELTKFDEKISGSISRSDQAFLASALSLSAAISGAPAIELPQSASTSKEIVSRKRALLKAEGIDKPTSDQLAPGPDTKIEIPKENAADGLTDGFETIERTKINTTPGVGVAKDTALHLEPNEYLDQLQSYLNHLHEIRRINEGDDTGNSPGYALHLIRMPVSVLPGSKTRKGYGAEITVTATPYLGRELLPTTFRNLVVNDLTEQIGTPLAEFFNSKSSVKNLLENWEAEAYEKRIGKNQTKEKKNAYYLKRRLELDPQFLNHRSNMLRGDTAAKIRSYIQEPAKCSSGDKGSAEIGLFVEANKQTELKPSLSVPQNRGRNARFAFPALTMNKVYGKELMIPVAVKSYRALKERSDKDKDTPSVMPHHIVTSFVQDQVGAAYDYLSRPENLMLLTTYGTTELASAVQANNEVEVARLRNCFLAAMGTVAFDKPEHEGDDAPVSFLAAFSWAIIVESVLLNERLVADIKDSAAAKGVAVAPADHLQFFLPDPSDEARDVFNAYVKNRFPIHVLAVDPAVAEQNISDVFARSRELQLALSLAFVSGNISASSMTRLARRLEQQSQTIALQRTQIAFSHGEDTFGWRFQPRFQTPPIQNNAVAFGQTLIGGPTRDGDRRQTELEPGIRECVAIVIMPSFVPYVTLETRSNWYRLNSPKHAEIDAVKFLDLSKSIKNAYNIAQTLCDSGQYRDGDVSRLVNRVKQLSAELPFQSMMQQVPHENTLGGFELFNVGITDLAPQIRSWYGAPGISPNNGTSLFITGDNFSVHETSVIVGNKLLATPGSDFSLLSRQVMRINVPPGTQFVVHNGEKSVEVSVATPYGVSQSLYIPVYPTEEKKDPEVVSPSFSWKPEKINLAYQYDNLGISRAVGPNTVVPPAGISIALDSGVALHPTKADLRLIFDKPFDKLGPIDLDGVPYNNDTGAFEITGDLYTTMITKVFATFAVTFKQTHPPVDVQISQTVIRLRTGSGPIIPQAVSNPITIGWTLTTEARKSP